MGLWITFKSCIFAFWNNCHWFTPLERMVVNYIQILYLCILKQQYLHHLYNLHSCELHSNLVSLHSETTTAQDLSRLSVLWITFKSCIFAFWNNNCGGAIHGLYVVNYIQILYLCILKQQLEAECRRLAGCELHSNLVSLHSETTCLCCVVNRL